MSAYSRLKAMSDGAVKMIDVRYALACRSDWLKTAQQRRNEMLNSLLKTMRRVKLLRCFCKALGLQTSNLPAKEPLAKIS